jgi:hypothetical protein
MRAPLMGAAKERRGVPRPIPREAMPHLAARLRLRLLRLGSGRIHRVRLSVPTSVYFQMPSFAAAMLEQRGGPHGRGS